MSVLLVAVVGGVTVAATRAYFTNQSILGASTISSGTLTVNATSNNHGYLDLGTLGKLEPEMTTEPISIIVKNTGNLKAATFGKFITPEGNGLDEALNFYDYKVEFFNADNTPITARGVDVFVVNGVGQGAFATQYPSGKVNLKAWIDGNGPLDIPGASWDEEALRPGQYIKITFKLQMDKNAGNTYQNKYVKLGYQVESTQVNKDAILGLGLGGNMATAIDSHYTYLYNQVNP